MSHWESWLTQRLTALRPDAICVLDAAADRLAALALPATRRYPVDACAPDQNTLALGINALTGLDAAAAAHLIHRVRLYAAPRLMLMARADCVLNDAAFRALGFVCEAIDTEAGVRIQSYDLATYKSTPDWLNARFWAHPDRWSP